MDKEEPDFLNHAFTDQDGLASASYTRKTALKISAFYAVFGSLWIIFSGILALKFFGTQNLLLVEIFKGLFFIVVTSGLVYWLASRAGFKVVNAMQAKQLTKAKGLMQATFASMGDAIFVIDAKTRTIEECNPAAENLFGYSRDELLGQSTEILHINNNSFEKFGDKSQMVLDQSGVFHTEYCMRKKDGSIMHTDNTVKEMDPTLGWRGGVVSVIRDITERKKTEKERKNLIKELEKRNEELEHFTYTISHDLKTPVVTIGGFVGQLRKDLDDGNMESVSTDIDFIESATKRMGLLLNNLLHLARSGKVIDEPRPVNLVEVARETVKATLAKADRLRVHFNMPGDMPLVSGDPERLKEVFQNLFENAAKFTSNQASPLIEVSCKTECGMATCFVKDNGVGIPAEFQEKVFGLFEKLDPDNEGSGIGLAIVRRIIREHGGDIWIESSQQGQGTTIAFTVPLNHSRDHSDNADQVFALQYSKK